MFFHTLLLQPQHKMQLSLPWIAATLGVKKIKKDDLLKCNVVKVCDQILIFVRSDSLNPHKRFSLRLSAILISGVCKILRQQVIFLRDEIDRSLVDREKVADRLWNALCEDGDTPPTPKPKIRKKKVKPQQTDTPESLVERIGLAVPRVGRERSVEPEFTLEPLRLPEIPVDEAFMKARVDEITLREEVSGPREPQLLDDFGLIEEIPLQPIPSTSTAPETTVADIPTAPKSPRRKEKPQDKRSEEETVPQVEAPIEKVVRQEGVKQDLPQIQVKEIQAIVEQPPEKEPAIQVIPEVDVISAPQKKKEADKDEEAVQKDAMKDQRVSPVQKKKASDIAQLRVVEPEVELREPTRRGGKNIASFLLLKKKKKKFVFINQVEQFFKDEPNFIPITKTIPDFKPMLKFWPDWDTMHLEVEAARPNRNTGSIRASGATDGSLVLGVDRSAETPEISAASMALAQQIDTPSEVATPEPRYVSTPRKRPLQSEETMEEILPPAANGEMGPPEMLPRKRKKVVSIEEVQAAELLASKKGIPEEQLAILQEPSEIQPMGEPEIPPPEDQRPVEVHEPVIEAVIREPVRKDKSPEKRVSEDVEERVRSPRIDQLQVDFGVKWSKEIIQIIYQHDKIDAAEICRALHKRMTKLNMSVVFATLLTLAKDRYVLLHSAADSCELEYIEKGPKEFTF